MARLLHLLPHVILLILSARDWPNDRLERSRIGLASRNRAHHATSGRGNARRFNSARGHHFFSSLAIQHARSRIQHVMANTQKRNYEMDYRPLQDAAAARLSTTTIYVRDKLVRLKECRWLALTDDLVEHARQLLERHVSACISYEIEPEFDRTIIEAVEDYQLAQRCGQEFSVLAAIPEDAIERLLEAWPRTRYDAYTPPAALNGDTN